MQHVVKSLESVNSFILWNLIGPSCFLIGLLSLVVGREQLSVSPYQQGGGQVRAQLCSPGHTELCRTLPPWLRTPRCSLVSAQASQWERKWLGGERLCWPFIPGFQLTLQIWTHQTETFNRVRRGLSPQTWTMSIRPQCTLPCNLPDTLNILSNLSRHLHRIYVLLKLYKLMSLVSVNVWIYLQNGQVL